MSWHRSYLRCCCWLGGRDGTRARTGRFSALPNPAAISSSGAVSFEIHKAAAFSLSMGQWFRTCCRVKQEGCSEQGNPCVSIIKAMSEIQLLLPPPPPHSLMVGVVCLSDCVWIYGSAASKYFFISLSPK